MKIKKQMTKKVHRNCRIVIMDVNAPESHSWVSIEK